MAFLWTDPQNTFSLDGKRVVTLVDSEYACSITSPEHHVLRIGHEGYSFEAAAGDERYIRVTSLSSDSNHLMIEETVGYEFDVDPLRPAYSRRSCVPCSP